MMPCCYSVGQDDWLILMVTSHSRMVVATQSGNAADRFPALVALGEHVWVDNRDERFTAGLDMLVDGLQRAQHAPHRPTLDGQPATTRTTRPREAAQKAADR